MKVFISQTFIRLSAAIFSCFLIFSSLRDVYAASLDFNGDGKSDPAAVEIADSLSWHALINGTSSSVAVQFGRLGDHLAAGHYSGSGKTDAAYIEKNGTWHILTPEAEKTFSHGSKRATYLAGADVDGDGNDDAIYHTQTCRKKIAKVLVRLNPIGSDSRLIEVKGGSGLYFSTYGDANGDAKDDFCWLEPISKRKRLNGRFVMYCKDVVSGENLVRFRVGKVYGRPIPIKNKKGQADYFAFPKTSSGKTIVTVRDTKGRLIKNIRFKGKGTLLVGIFKRLAKQREQVALALDKSIKVYDFTTDQIEKMPAPEGIKFDEFNVNHFRPASTACHCTSKTIRRGQCQGNNDTADPDDGGDGKDGGDDNDGGDLTGSCQVSRDISDGYGNWLHKPVSDSTGSIVNLFNPADRPQNCRYESRNGRIFKDAYFTGNSNPDRPTWRPVGGGSCSSFPKPLVVACQVKNKKHCWVVPNACNRYD